MKRKAIAIREFGKNLNRISKNEQAKHANRRTEVSDSIISLKAHAKTGGNVALLDAENNDKGIIGVVDFEQGEIKGMEGKGSIMVDAMKVGFATGVAADNAYDKSFKQNNFPADLEHAYLEVKQDDKIIKKIKLSRFSLAGDEAQSMNGGVEVFGTPFVLAGGTETEIILRRPKGIAGTEGFLSIDFIGMQSVNSGSNK